jgi:hypothetical protein
MSKSGGTSSNITSNNTVKLGGDGSFVNVNAELEPVTVNANLAVTQPIVTQSTANSTSTANLDLKIEPLDLKVEPLDLKIEPLKVSSDSAIDVKPLAVDSCSTVRLAPLPPIRMEQPYSQHLGITYMGVELWGISVSGKSEMFLYSPPKDRPISAHSPEPYDCGSERESKRKPEFTRPTGGLRVRVK